MILYVFFYFTKLFCFNFFFFSSGSIRSSLNETKESVYIYWTEKTDCICEINKNNVIFFKKNNWKVLYIWCIYILWITGKCIRLVCPRYCFFCIAYYGHCEYFCKSNFLDIWEALNNLFLKYKPGEKKGLCND